MNQGRRIVITGMGQISPIGLNIHDAWKNCLLGKSGITSYKVDVDNIPVSIAGRILQDGKEYIPGEKYVEKKLLRRLDPFVLYGLVAAQDALEDAGITKNHDLDAAKVGVNIGSGIGGLYSIERNKLLLEQKSHRAVSPFFVPGSIINMTAGYLSMLFNFKGPNLSITTACASSNHAIGLSARLIAAGDADVMIAGGAEMATTPLGISGFLASKALSISENPITASRPWDKNRNGFVLSDGAGILILEEYEHALKRGANIYAELVGFGMSADAHHMTAPPSDGYGAALSIKNALSDAGIDSDQIDYINAHATSTPLGDLAECNAIKSVFKNPPIVSSTKSMTGHTLGAAGAIESIFSILSIKDNHAPPTINLKNPDDDCDLDFVANSSRKFEINTAMNNSFGFGGTNSTLIFRSI